MVAVVLGLRSLLWGHPNHPRYVEARGPKESQFASFPEDFRIWLTILEINWNLVGAPSASLTLLAGEGRLEE